MEHDYIKDFFKKPSTDETKPLVTLNEIMQEIATINERLFSFSRHIRGLELRLEMLVTHKFGDKVEAIDEIGENDAKD